MRRFFWGLAIASLTVSAPVTAYCGDREIADSIISTIKEHQSNGSLKGFDIDLNVESGVVTLSGTVANADQATSVLAAAYAAAGVVDVVDNISVRKASIPKNLPAPLATAAFGSQSRQDVRQVSNVEGESSVPLTLDSDDMPALPAMPAAAEPPKLQVSAGSASAHDAAITDEALGLLSKAKSAGTLRQFDLDLSTVDGEVWVKGSVANAQQKQLVLSTVQHVRGVKKVIDDLKVVEAKATKVQPASNTSVIEPTQYGSMPMVGAPSTGPRPFAPSTVSNYQEGIVSSGPIPGIPVASPQGAMQSPVPMNMGQSYGAGVPRYDQPQMPGYAWPSYAAYPNYSAVTYPKQYSASAWPYIGPFYPYPQVPLGWRRVALEWDDGLWYLDFTSK
jgi:osmotically-inducible protein OsmY